MNSVIAIVGPTASGKSELALHLAERFSGEIVNYDSVQIFRHLNIGGAKPSAEERARVPHHLIDIREPTDVYTAGDYRYHGADMGILVARGRMQTDDRKLHERAKRWAAGINSQFHCVPVAPEVPVHIPDPTTTHKMY